MSTRHFLFTVNRGPGLATCTITPFQHALCKTDEPLRAFPANHWVGHVGTSAVGIRNRYLLPPRRLWVLRRIYPELVLRRGVRRSLRGTPHANVMEQDKFPRPQAA